MFRERNFLYLCEKFEERIWYRLTFQSVSFQLLFLNSIGYLDGYQILISIVMEIMFEGVSTQLTKAFV